MAIPTLRSPTIPAGGLIADRHTTVGMGISPALSWRRPPPGHPYLTVVVRSWLPNGTDENIHWLVFDVPEFFGGIQENVGHDPNWATGQNSNGDASYLPFSGTRPRQARFEMYASRSVIGLDGPASWEDISVFLKKQESLGPFGFVAYDASLPALVEQSQ